MTCAVLFWLLGVSVPPALGQPPPPEPTWAVEVAADSLCADSRDFIARLSAQVPEAQRAPLSEAELRVHVFVGHDRRAEIRVFDQSTGREAGKREISVPANRCDQVAEALALVISVMAEAGRGSLRGELEDATNEPPPSPPPAPDLPEPVEPAPPPRRIRAERHAWLGPPPGHDVAAAAGVSHGLLPGWSLALSLGWSIRWSGVWPIWIHATSVLSAPNPDPRSRIDAAYGTLATCPLHLERAWFRGQLCPGIALGAVWAEGRQVVASRRSVDPLALAGVTVSTHLRLIGPLELAISARVEAPLTRLEFVYYRQDGAVPQLHETKPVVASFLGAIGLRFR